MTRDKTTWISCRIRPTTSVNTFLLETMWPFVEKAFEKDWITNFFFIRYMDTEPHIRLRLNVRDEYFEKGVKPALKTVFPELTFIPYNPEMKDYLKPQEIIVVEKQFESSSRAVLSLLNKKPTMNYSQAINAAMQMHVAMAVAFGLSRKEASDFFYHLATHYHNNDPKKLSDLETQVSEQKALTAFLSQLWNALENKNTVADEWYNMWFREMQLLPSKFKTHQQRNYESFVHMTNNRLGISNDDEVFIAYIIAKSLEGENSE